MGFRFRKSVNLLPGVRLNFNKKSTGVTVGDKGLHYTVNSKGKRTTTVGVPGTGLSYRTTSGVRKAKTNRKDVKFTLQSNISTTPSDWIPLDEPAQKPEKKPMATWLTIFLLFFFAPVGIYFVWKNDKLGRPLKTFLSIVFGLFFSVSLLSSCSGNGTSYASSSAYSSSIVDSSSLSVSSAVSDAASTKVLVSSSSSKYDSSSSEPESSLMPAASLESSSEAVVSLSSSKPVNESSSEKYSSMVSSSFAEAYSSQTSKDSTDNVTSISSSAHITSSTAPAISNNTVTKAPEQSITYVLNTSTKKIHYQSCSSVKKIKAKNYAESNLSIEKLIAQGYDPCGNCKPR